MVSSNVKPLDPVLGFIINSQSKFVKIQNVNLLCIYCTNQWNRAVISNVGIGPWPIRKTLRAHFLISTGQFPEACFVPWGELCIITILSSRGAKRRGDLFKYQMLMRLLHFVRNDEETLRKGLLGFWYPVACCGVVHYRFVNLLQILLINGKHFNFWWCLFAPTLFLMAS